MGFTLAKVFNPRYESGWFVCLYHWNGSSVNIKRFRSHIKHVYMNLMFEYIVDLPFAFVFSCLALPGSMLVCVVCLWCYVCVCMSVCYSPFPLHFFVQLLLLVLLDLYLFKYTTHIEHKTPYKIRQISFDSFSPVCFSSEHNVVYTWSQWANNHVCVCLCMHTYISDNRNKIQIT